MKRIVTRLAIWIAIAIAMSSLILFAGARSFLAYELLQRDKSYITQECFEYGRTFTLGGVDAVQRQYAQESRDAEDLALYIRILSPQGATLLEKAHRAWDVYDLHPLRDEVSNKALGWHRVTRTDGDDTVLDVVGESLNNGDIIQVGMSSAYRDDFIDNFSAIFVRFALLAIAISTIVGMIVARSSLRPLLRFKDRILRISESVGHSGQREKIGGFDYREISEISEAFNALLERVLRLISSLRDGLDGIAHEIRSPLTRLRMNAERALLTGDEKGKEESLAEAIEETERISKIVDVMMRVAEAEGQFVAPNRTDFNCNHVLDRVFNLYEDTAHDKHINLKIIPVSGVVLHADFEQVVQAISNLVDNAIKFSKAGDEVTLAVEAADDSVTFRVADRGAGISPDELPLIWQRLFRGRSAKNSTGLGLGLALVQAIAKSHGGSVSVESSNNLGTVFSVVFPRGNRNSKLSANG